MFIACLFISVWRSCCIFIIHLLCQSGTTYNHKISK